MPETAKEPGYQFMAMGYFMVLVTLLSRCYGQKLTVSSEKIMNVGKAIGHMERNFGAEIEVDELARIAHMSRRSFYRVFQEVTNESPASYLQHLRVMKSAHLLQTTERSITETAFECGFEDSNYFARVFGRIMGMTPREYKSRTIKTPRK